MRLLIITFLSAGFLMTGLPLPKVGSHYGSGPMTIALADDDDGGDDDNGGGDDRGGDDDDDDGDDDDSDDGPRGTFGASRDGYEPAREILAIDADPALIQALEADGFVERDRQALSSLQVSVSRLTIPPTLNLPAALARARQVAPGVAYEPNPVYRLATSDDEPAEIAQAPCNDSDCYALDLVGWPDDPARCGEGLRIGMTDTAVNPRHPA